MTAASWSRACGSPAPSCHVTADSQLNGTHSHTGSLGIKVECAARAFGNSARRVRGWKWRPASQCVGSCRLRVRDAGDPVTRLALETARLEGGGTVPGLGAPSPGLPGDGLGSDLVDAARGGTRTWEVPREGVGGSSSSDCEKGGGFLVLLGLGGWGARFYVLSDACPDARIECFRNLPPTRTLSSSWGRCIYHQL